MKLWITTKMLSDKISKEPSIQLNFLTERVANRFGSMRPSGDRSIGRYVVGLHFCGCEMAGGVWQGITAHVGTKVTAQVGPDEVPVASAKKNSATVSGQHFIERGADALKELSGKSDLFAVVKEVTPQVR